MSRPETLSGRLSAGLCVFGLTYACGLTWAGTPKANPKPLTARDVVDTAAEAGLSWVEMPVGMLGEDLAELRAYGEARGIRFVVAGGRVDLEILRRDLSAAIALGAPTVRCTLSGILCGDRRGFPGGWKSHLEQCERIIAELLPELERAGVALAVENHQDADSEDLLRLCRRFESRYVGVTLDCGNPLAVMEEPMAFATRLAPYLRHAHQKDYRIYHAPNGFRLVRVALGEGAIRFAELYRLLDEQEFPITRNIEMAALQARQIPILEPTWWDEYAPRDRKEILPALQAVWENLRPLNEEHRTPFELDVAPGELAKYEWRQFRTSVEYLRELERAG